MMNQRRIVAVDGDRRIVQRGQQILLNVANLGRVLLEAGNHELNMMGIELEKTRTDNLCRVITAGNTDIFLGSANRINEQLQDLLDFTEEYLSVE